MSEKKYKKAKTTGRITLPSEENFYDETIELIERLGVDVLRDSDGTKLPDELKKLDEISVYTKYLTARGHNDFAKEHPTEVTRFYLMSEFVTATSEETQIKFMEEYFDQQIKPDYDHDVKEWWEVIDRTTGEVVDINDWEIDKENNIANIKTIPFHEYTVSFLAYCYWDPVHMYNYITNDWDPSIPHAIPLDPRYDATAEFLEKYLDEFLEKNPLTDVIRFTTFFYQFSLIFNKHGLEKHVEWFGYTNTVSPKAFKEFEKEYGYKLRPEDIIDEGYYNSIFRVPSKAFRDYIEFQNKFVTEKAKRLVDIVHKHGKKAIMFLGDHYTGVEPWGKNFANIGLDGVVGSVGDGVTLRLISDIDTPMTEGRFLPYFFPDTFYEGNDPTIEGKDNWVKARRALIRKPLDRIGYGGYMSLAYKFTKFIDYIQKVADEFRDLHDIVTKDKPVAKATVAILNHWGAQRKWTPWIVAHGKWYKLSYSYMGITEALSGMDMDVRFINFEDVRNGIDPDIDVIINAGDAYTAFSGGAIFEDEEIVTKLREFVYNGGGFIGVGEPSAHHYGNGRYFQLADVMGVDKEIGFSQSTNKYFVDEVESHFITEDLTKDVDFGESQKNVYSISENTEILEYSNHEVHMAANDYGKGRSFYIAGLPYSQENTRLLKRAIHYVAHKEDELKKYYAEDVRVEVAAFKNLKKYCVINNSLDDVTTTVYDGKGNPKEVTIESADLIWFEE
ncbi:1,3-beta-galactosyl-N-acetylhexosamine phosphorylase [Helcococcus kunzii]|uniref:1,3-beta-galactosyl-N-acetylhexosamine phosphorylase n=1 Tax=Helcococcus kunzii TaxID=40091 RepID=UPI001C97FE01|nr:1,3-beta-galactosyl-N-acetylhexosamine phosphorylase [Helcococcus kunzii]QZO76064.1 1,3-beta-galactosyl-N-acetylhexosamine phosphorylase [Helcococcus kunzii]